MTDSWTQVSSGSYIHLTAGGRAYSARKDGTGRGWVLETWMMATPEDANLTQGYATLAAAKAEADRREREPEPVPQAERIERAYYQGGSAATADAQAAKAGGQFWRSRHHMLPADADERAAWMQGYGQVFAWWGGASGDSMGPGLRRIAQDGITGNLHC